jgi:hypothetical protein
MATYKCPIAACTIKPDKVLITNAVLAYLKVITGFKTVLGGLLHLVKISLLIFSHSDIKATKWI